MSKKFFILTLGLVLVFSLSACGKKDEINSKDSSKEKYSKLGEWLQSGEAVVCDVETGQGRITVKTKQDKVRMDGAAWMDLESLGEEDIKSGSYIADSEWIYVWSGNRGMKMNLSQIKELADKEDQEIEKEDYSWEKWAEEQDEMNVQYSCRKDNISDSEFVPPSDVEFVDWSEIMEGFMQMSRDFNNSGDLPQVEGSQNMTQEEIEAQLEEMMNGAGR